MTLLAWMFLIIAIVELGLIGCLIAMRRDDLALMEAEIRERTRYKESDFLKHQEMVQNEREKIEQDLMRKLEQRNQANFIAPCDGEFWLDEHFVKLRKGESYTYQWRPNATK